MAVRGLGLTFYDVAACLTAGRGGRFRREPGGRLRYLASGREPRLVAGSRSGLPFLARLAAEHGVPDLPGLGLAALARPFSGQAFARSSAFRDQLIRLLHADVAAARAGTAASPLKAAMETLRSLRPALPGIVDLGGLLPRSQRDFLDRFAPMSYLLSAGPPAAEVERLTALLEASVVEVPGPSARFSRGKRPGSFVVGSAAVPGSGRLARTLVEARPRRRPGRSAGYGLIIPACIQSVSSRPVQPRWV